MGDFNIDLLKYENCTYSQTLLHCIQSFSMLPVVDKPTRVSGTSATLIKFLEIIFKTVLLAEILLPI